MANYGSIQGYDTMKGFNVFSAPGDGGSLGGLDPGHFSVPSSTWIPEKSGEYTLMETRYLSVTSVASVTYIQEDPGDSLSSGTSGFINQMRPIRAWVTAVHSVPGVTSFTAGPIKAALTVD